MNTMQWSTTLWGQALCLLVALLLSTAIGAERQARHKDAGTRTHALVGLGSALFVILSKFGFADVLSTNLIELDPSRLAAQIVSGIGFIGAGVVFMQRSRIRGLTTAASIWLTAAVGSSCGAGLLIQAAVCTGMYFFVVIAFPLLGRQFGPLLGVGDSVHVDYQDGHGVLRSILTTCARHGFAVEGFSTRGESDGSASDGKPSNQLASGGRMVSVDLEVRGRGFDELIEDITSLGGVTSVVGVRDND